MNRKKKKLLHLKVIYDEKVIKEVKTDDSIITIGYSIDNSIPIKISTFQKSLEIFFKKRGVFYLKITKDIIDGTISIGASTLHIRDLLIHGLLVKDDGCFIHKISEGCHGNILIQGIRIDFSLCDPSPPLIIPKVRFDISRHFFIRKEDKGFLFILFFSIFIHSSTLYYIENTKLPEESITNISVISKRFARLILEPPKVKTNGIKVEAEKKDNKDKKRDEKETKEEQKREEEKVSKEEDKEEKKKEDIVSATETQVAKLEQSQKTVTLEDSAMERRARVQKKGLLAMLVGKRYEGNSTNTKGVMNIIRDKDVSQDLDRVLKDVGGLTLTIPSPKGEMGIKRDSYDDRTVAIEDIIAKRQKEFKEDIEDVKLKEKTLVSMSDLFDLAGEGARDPKRSKEVIASVVQTYLGGIKYLYNRELRKNPGLQGKVLIEFTILADGGVVNTTILETTMYHKEFEDALIRRIITWKFAPIEAGEVTIRYPFVFFPIVTG